MRGHTLSWAVVGQDNWSSRPGLLSWVSLEPGFGEAECSAGGVRRELLSGGRQAVPCPHSPVLSWGPVCGSLTCLCPLGLSEGPPGGLLLTSWTK